MHPVLRRLALLGALSWALAIAPGTAAAQAGGSTSSDPERDEIARRHFEWGREAYDRGEFEQAITEFQEAYRLSQRPTLFYNLYLAYRDARQDQQAADALRRYLAEVPEIPNRAQLESRLRILDEAIARNEPPPPETAEVEEEEDEREEVVDAEVEQELGPTTPSSGGGGLGPWPWVVIGVGGATLVAGAITGGLAMGAAGDLSSMCNASGDCPSSARPTYDRGDTLATVTNALLPVGGVIAATGIVLLIVDLTSAHGDAPPAAAACTGDGCIAFVRGTF